MKKQLLLAILIATLSTTQAQIYFAGSFGMGTTGSAAAGAATLGVDFNHWLVQGGFHSHLSAKQPTLYRLTAGRSFEVGEMAYINLTGGVGSLDRYFNKGAVMTGKDSWVASVEYAKDYMGKGEWFVEMTQAKRYNFITLGLKYFFVGGKEKTGCPASW